MIAGPRMIKRCGTLTDVPPPADWDGTWDSYVACLNVLLHCYTSPRSIHLGYDLEHL